MATTAAVMQPEKYLELERAAPEKHEFVDGQMVAMAGGSAAHAAIIANVIMAAGPGATKKGCITFSSDLRVCLAEGAMFVYPDVVVACGQPTYYDGRRDTITNPVCVIEVLSPSTVSRDRGDKAHCYRLTPSIQEFLLIGQTPVDIEHYRRMPDGIWQIVEVREGGIRLDSLDCTLAVAEIYRGVALLLA